MSIAAGMRSKIERDARTNLQCRSWREGVSWAIRPTSQVFGNSLARFRNFWGSGVIVHDLCRRRATGEQVRPNGDDTVTKLHAFGKIELSIAFESGDVDLKEHEPRLAAL
jgi:predicted oxidoreductase